ncbi:DUF4279 domain-containing protein [Flavihumibacter petaseus]|uniref:Uncharacterized protein n=1 Tax=Flavihumibacter petaseus NBRC 106054 TaxID=1220578 RepID=A0A0E9N5X2_9BACT|nr:DUF4279 domain-containing protein [Flavihumibacter petaseus]GAO45357.1 hypothetical protein FPE01S_05_00540 [Flavihumibacter petaseus NBRC 106054]
MSCILTISGRNFDIDQFIDKSNLKPFRKSYKGQPRFKTKPDGAKLTQSSISIETSKADFDNLTKQISDTVRYLKRNKDNLVHIATFKGIDHAVLDFGVDLRIDKVKVLTQSDTFPNALLKLAGDLGLDIELSIYPVDLQSNLERRRTNA